MSYYNLSQHFETTSGQKFLYTSEKGIFAQNFWLKIHFLYTSDHDYSDLLVRNAVGRKVGNPSITVYTVHLYFLEKA